MATKNTKKILINATHPEEIRIALLEGKTLFDYHSEHYHLNQTKDNVYLGNITRIEPGLEAVFVKYSSNAQTRQGFLPLKEIHPGYFTQPIDSLQGKINVKEVLKEQTPILVQVDKEERSNKGAALTTFISLAGCYLVLMPNNPRAGGISKQIEGGDREDLKKILSALPIPEGMGVIARTACIGKTESELKHDLEYLLHQWDSIQRASQEHVPPTLIYQEDVVTRSIRDYVRQDTDEIWIDEPAVHDKVKQYLSSLRPDCIDRVQLYEGRSPLFSAFDVERQIEVALQREVRLHSGGTLVIDRTEAMVAIDVNSAQATRGADIEETAFHTNLEAAAEVARQLRLRDLGGLIVIDFIDMSSQKHRREVESALQTALTSDRARVQIGRISKFGLLEMSRQRIRSALGETTQMACPRCGGQGAIRHVHSLALSMIRLLEDSALNAPKSTLALQVPVDLATYLINEKRSAIQKIEQMRYCKILIIPNPNLETPHYRLSYLDSAGGASGSEGSHLLVETPSVTYQPEERNSPAEAPILKSMPLPSASKAASTEESLLQKLWGALFRKKTLPASISSSENVEQRPSEHTVSKPGQPGEQSKRRDNNPRNSRNKRTHSRSGGRSRRSGTNRKNSADGQQNRQIPRQQQAVPSQPTTPITTAAAVPSPITQSMPLNDLPPMTQQNKPKTADAPVVQYHQPSAPTAAESQAQVPVTAERSNKRPHDQNRRRNTNYLRHGRRNKPNGNQSQEANSASNTPANHNPPENNTASPEASTE